MNSSRSQKPDTISLVFLGHKLILMDLDETNQRMKEPFIQSKRSNQFPCMKNTDYFLDPSELNEPTEDQRLVIRSECEEEDRLNQQQFLLGLGLLTPLRPHLSYPIKEVFQGMWHSNIQLSDSPQRPSVEDSLMQQEFYYFQATPTMIQFIGPHAVFTVVKLLDMDYSTTSHASPDSSFITMGGGASTPTVQFDRLKYSWKTEHH